MAAMALENARLHRALAERGTEIQCLVDANIVGIFFWGPEGQILEANDAFLQIVAYDREDLVSGRMRWMDVMLPEERGDCSAQKVGATAQDKRVLATLREGVLAERRQPCARADKFCDVRRKWGRRRHFRARFD
jgi:PAS domain-containing protein